MLRRLQTTGAIFALSTLLLSVPSADAVTTATSVDVSPDVSVDLSGATYDDDAIAIDDFVTTSSADLGNLPNAGDIDGYHLLTNGDQLISFDTTVDLGAGVVAGPEDVVLYDGNDYSLLFDGSAAGLPPGVNVDSVTEDGPDLVLSFDTAALLGGSSYDDEDLVLYSGGVFSLYFDGSVEGVPPALDINGAHAIASNGHLVLSFDTSGSVGGVAFDDEDTLEYDGLTWELAYDGSAEHAGWGAGDIDALNVMVPEPALVTALIAGIAFLAALGRMRGDRGRVQS